MLVQLKEVRVKNIYEGPKMRQKGHDCAVITEYCNMSLHGLTEHKKMKIFICLGSL